MPQLSPVLDRLPPGARILELGCGPGREAAHVIARGFAVDATDAAAAMVAVARASHGVAARRMRFDELEGSRRLRCGVGERLPDPRAARRLSCGAGDDRTRAAAQGLAFASFKLGTGESRDALGRLHNFPDLTWLRRAYCAAGFATEQEGSLPRQADGMERNWCALTSRKPV